MGDVAGSGPDAERWLTPSDQLCTMRRVQLLCAVVLALVIGVMATLAVSPVAAVLTALAVLAVGAVGERLVRRRFRSWGYLERSADFLVRRGVLFQRLTVVPYGRMQLVDVTAGAVERLFGLSTVRLHTAAATTDARIPGLEPAEASRLRDRLAQLGESQAAGI